MNNNNNNDSDLKWFSALLFVFLLWGCGGGGSSNSPPTSVSISKTSVLEGTTGAAVGTLSTADADGGVFTYSLSGTDASSFVVSGSSLRLASDVAADYDTKTSYSISVRSTDSGNLSVSKNFTISVLDAIKGRVVDAPLRGSSVFIDVDGDLVRDPSEPSATSDSDGFFALENQAGSGLPKMISIGGTDTKTGQALPNLALMSDLPSDTTKSIAVTPITTLVAVAETPAAKAKVLTALGVTGTVEDLLTTDSWAAAEAGDTNAKELQRKNQQIGLILQTAESLVDSSSSTKATDVTQAVAKQLVEVTGSSDSIDLTQTAIITQVLTDSMAEVASSATVSAEAIAAVSNSVSQVNTLVADTSLDPTGDASAEILEAAQTTLQDSAEALVAGTVDVAAFTSATDSKNLFEGSTVLEALPDADGDGLSNAIDPDDDNDGVLDIKDGYPGISIGSLLDTDKDGRPDSCDSACIALGMVADDDDDDDGVLDTKDSYSLISLGGLLDTDSDGRPDDCNDSCIGLGMLADLDDDADGISDSEDVAPLDDSRPPPLFWDAGNWGDVKWQ